MKKIYFFIFIIFAGKSVAAQAYFPLLDSVNHWQNITNTIPIRLAAPSNVANLPCMYPMYYSFVMEEFTTQDSVINSVNYKMVCATADFNPTPCIIGFIREDTASRKVYFMDNAMNPEVLLYDFSMVIGNTIPVSFMTNNYYTSGTFTLDSIGSTHIQQGFRSVFYLSNHAVPFGPVLTWIESVGCPVNAFYPVAMNNYGYINQFSSCTVYAHDAEEFMTCFDHMSRVYYDSCAYQTALANFCFDVQDTCNYHNICGSVEEHASLSSIAAFPNPSNGKITISIDVKQKDDFKIIVWDISGKKVMREIPLGILNEGRKNIELDLSELQSGFYQVECRGEKNAAYTKLLITN